MSYDFTGDLSVGALSTEGAFEGGALFTGDLYIHLPTVEGDYEEVAQFTGDLELPEIAIEGDLVAEATFTGDLAVDVLYMFGEILAVPAETFSAYAMNLRNFAVGKYTNFPFRSVAIIGGKAYGANASGLYLLEGDDDAGTDIDAEVKTGLTDFGSDRYKRIKNAGLSCRSDGEIAVSTFTDEDTEYAYSTYSTGKSGVHNRRVRDMGKGIKSGHWQFGVKNGSGVDFEMFGLEIDATELARRAD